MTTTLPDRLATHLGCAFCLPTTADQRAIAEVFCDEMDAFKVGDRPAPIAPPPFLFVGEPGASLSVDPFVGARAHRPVRPELAPGRDAAPRLGAFVRCAAVLLTLAALGCGPEGEAFPHWAPDPEPVICVAQGATLKSGVETVEAVPGWCAVPRPDLGQCAECMVQTAEDCAAMGGEHARRCRGAER